MPRAPIRRPSPGRRRRCAAFKRRRRTAGELWARWTTAERLRFLNGLPRELPQPRLAELDRALGLIAEPATPRLLFAWLQLALANRYEPAVPAAERFLTAMGRRKFVAPLFETLVGAGRMGPADRRRESTRAPGRPTIR